VDGVGGVAVRQLWGGKVKAQAIGAGREVDQGLEVRF
jgi:hypothetical protein